MHTLTLTFGSTQDLLDFAAKHLTNAIGPAQLTVAGVNAMRLPDVEVSGGETKEVKPAKKTKVKVEETPAPAAEEAKPEIKPTKNPVREVAEKEAAAESDGRQLDLKKDVRPHALALMKANRTALLGLFDEFGVANLDELTVDQLPAFLAKVKAELPKEE